jgi:hypothetical protein
MINEADQACIRFRIVPDFNHFIRKPVHLDYLKDIPVLSLRKEPLDDVGNRIKKRLLRLMISSLVTIFILSWLDPDCRSFNLARFPRSHFLHSAKKSAKMERLLIALSSGA